MTRTNANGYWSLDEEAQISWKLYQILSHANAECVGQNFIYDIQYFWKHLFFLPKLSRDTMLGQHVCFSTMPKSLDYLGSMYAAHYVYWKDEGKEWKPNDKSTEEEFWSYNCEDAVYTFEVDTVIQRVVDQMGLRTQHDFQMSMFYPVLQTMNRGVLVDESERKRIGKEMKAEMESIKTWITGLIGHDLNLNSPAQLSKFFFKDLGLPSTFNRKTGNVTTDEQALEKIAARESLMQPLVDKIIRYRSLSTLYSNHITAKLGQDGRMRTSYNIGGTWTFRFNSREDAFGEGCNLQNWTTEEKHLLIPDPGMTFFDMDLDSADLRIVVAESGEENMAEWFDAGLKPYVMVAREFYHDDSITKEHEAYKTFKALCHGTHYLGQPAGLSAQTGLPISDVERIQAWYFKRFPKIRQWQERFKAQILARKSFSNVFGYKFLILDRIGGTVYNEAIAALPQSTVALLINRIYKNVFDNCPNIEVLLQTHDSISGQFPTSDTDACLAQLRAQSQIILPYPKPIIIPTSFKTSTKSYGDCN
jgi:DNA polymerase-1